MITNSCDQYDLQMITSRNHRVRVYLIPYLNHPLNTSTATAQFPVGYSPKPTSPMAKTRRVKTWEHTDLYSASACTKENQKARKKVGVRPRIQEPIPVLEYYSMGMLPKPLRRSYIYSSTSACRLGQPCHRNRTITGETNPIRAQRSYRSGLVSERDLLVRGQRGQFRRVPLCLPVEYSNPLSFDGDDINPSHLLPLAIPEFTFTHSTITRPHRYSPHLTSQNTTTQRDKEKQTSV